MSRRPNQNRPVPNSSTDRRPEAISLRPLFYHLDFGGFSHSHLPVSESGGTAFDHLVAESDARHDERGEIATAKAECAEGKLTHRPVLLRQYLKP
jgi:hypothetical protein